MIWFNCKKCGKTHGRADNSAGSMIFCDCGHGNTVPWESTTAEPAAVPVLGVPKVPELAPLQFDPVTIPLPPGMPPPKSAPSYPAPSVPASLEEDERPYRRGRTEKRDPDFCFNHQQRPKVQTCTDCNESFCSACLVKFQGTFLCSACKNFRTRKLELPPAASTMASASLLISLIAGPLTMCLLLALEGNRTMYILSWLSLLPQLLALGLGMGALWDAEKQQKAGGQWVAVSGVATAGMTCFMMILLQMVSGRLIG